MRIPAPRSWGIGGKLAASLVLVIVTQQTYETISDSRFTSEIIRIHGRAKVAAGEAALRAFYFTSREDHIQRLHAATREPRFKAVLRLGDGPTLAARLRELLTEQAAFAATFTRPDGSVVASAARGPGLSIDAFLHRLKPLVDEAASGSASATWTNWEGLPLACSSEPVEINGELLGVLTLASELSDQTLRNLAETTGAEIVMHDERAILRHTPGAAVTSDQLFRHYEAARPAPGSRNAESIVLRLDNGSFFTASQPLRISAAEDVPLVSLLIPADEYLKSSRDFVSGSILRNSVSLVLMTLVVIWVVSRLTSPIRSLRIATERISAGDLDHRVPIASQDELGRLAAAFNEMATRVSGARRDLAEANTSLERQVEERTRSLQEQVRRREVAELELQRHAAELEQRVQERTAEIGRALATLDGMIDGALILDEASLRVTFANQGAGLQFARPREELLGKAYPEMLDPATAAELGSILALARRRAPAVVQFTSSHAREAGPALPVEINLQYSSPEGRPACFIAIARDISERRMLEERRNRAQRMEVLGTLAGGVAHDLNNALTPIAISIGLLRSRHPEDAATLEMLDRCCHQGAAMVRQLLTFARGREGERIPVDGPRLVKEMAQIVGSTFPRNITLEVNATAEACAIRGDATQIHQVLLNLCVNARDAMPDGGMLRLGVRSAEVPEDFPNCIPESRPGPHVCISVSDDGPGMPPHVAARIFEPFFTTKEPGKGTGLGLSTVLGIVRSHSGFLRLETEPGRGTLFEIYLPAETASTGTRNPLVREVPPVCTSRHLMLVEDNPAVRESYSAVLSSEGFLVSTATDGHDALSKIREARTPPELVITDLDMPVMGGRGLIEALRDALPGAPIIVITGLISPEEAANLRRDPRVRAVLPKPLALPPILHAIQEALDAPASTLA